MLSVSVVIATFQRAWALRYSLQSLANQTLYPDEIIIVLKPSGDGSEEVIKTFSKELPIKLIIQSRGFVAEAEEIGIKNSSKDILIFLDDDAIAEEEFVAKYVKFFEEHSDAGGVGGIIFKAYFKEDGIEKVNEYMYSPRVQNYIPKYCRPLGVFKGYHGWISKSGLLFSVRGSKSKILYDGVLTGANMGFLRSAVKDCPTGRLFRKSRKCYSWESVLAYWVRTKGFHTYNILDEKLAPIVWHIVHKYRLTAVESFWDRFWFSYDVFKNYYRYRSLRADVSFKDYLLASLAFLRKDFPARTLSFMYALLDS